MVAEAPPAPPAANDTLDARLLRCVNEFRTAENRRRAKAGQPAANDSELMQAWRSEMQSRRPKREPMPVYFDADGNSIDPPGGTSPPPPAVNPPAVTARHRLGSAAAGGAVDGTKPGCRQSIRLLE